MKGKVKKMLKWVRQTKDLRYELDIAPRVRCIPFGKTLYFRVNVNLSLGAHHLFRVQVMGIVFNTKTHDSRARNM